MRATRPWRQTVLRWFLVGIAFAGCVGCNESRWHEERFIIPVDSIGVPEQVAISDTLCVVFYGYIGGSSAFRFAGFDARRDSCDLWITAWGAERWNDHDWVGAPVVIRLDGEQYCLHGLNEGWFRITVHQPGGSTLEDSLWVSGNGEAHSAKMLP
ncbi:MAG: hypothetical protein KBD56_03905 [Candidatus Eisenbacteria bacterium]|nr:hypothetical protein [Candidatus Eisenbacteria bacterium]